MELVLIKEIIAGIIVGISFGIAMCFLRKAEKIKKHQEETGSNSRTAVLPSLGIVLLSILATVATIIYMSDTLGVEIIYHRGDSRVISFLGSLARFNWHASIPALATVILMLIVYGYITKRKNQEQKETADSPN